MATFTKRRNRDGTTSVRAQINMAGVREGQTWDSMAAARAWASGREADIAAGERGEIPDKKFGDLLAKYRDQVSPTKKGARFELVRLNRLLGNTVAAWADPTNITPRGGLKEPDPLALVHLKDLDGRAVSAWRDRRLAAGLRPASVRREWNQLSSCCTVAMSEWKWLRRNPFGKAEGVRRPPNSKKRDVRIQETELAALQAIADAHHLPHYRRVMRFLRFAIGTGMRSGEIVFLGQNPDRVRVHPTDPTRGIAHLPDTKNGDTRYVGLGPNAFAIWNAARDDATEESVWGLNSDQRDRYWRAMRDEAKLSHIHFHDSKHEAVTTLSKKLPPMALSRLVGTSLDIIMTYYSESAEDIALLL